MLRYLTIILVLPLVFSCDSTFDASRLEGELYNTTWVFQRADTNDGTVSSLPNAAQQASIKFGDRVQNAQGYEVTGYNGCNAFSGLYTLGSQNELIFSEIVQTERACMEDEARVEEVFNRAILGARSYSFDGEVLVIEAPGQSVTLRLIPTAGG